MQAPASKVRVIASSIDLKINTDQSQYVNAKLFFILGFEARLANYEQHTQLKLSTKKKKTLTLKPISRVYWM